MAVFWLTSQLLAEVFGKCNLSYVTDDHIMITRLLSMLCSVQGRGTAALKTSMAPVGIETHNLSRPLQTWPAGWSRTVRRHTSATHTNGYVVAISRASAAFAWTTPWKKKENMLLRLFISACLDELSPGSRSRPNKAFDSRYFRSSQPRFPKRIEEQLKSGQLIKALIWLCFSLYFLKKIKASSSS